MFFLKGENMFSLEKMKPKFRVTCNGELIDKIYPIIKSFGCKEITHNIIVKNDKDYIDSVFEVRVVDIPKYVKGIKQLNIPATRITVGPTGIIYIDKEN